MTEITYPRRWTAKIVVGGVVMDATDSEYDLQADMRKSAIREARMFTDEAEIVYAVIYKTTKGRGTEPDHQYYVYRDGTVSGPYWAGMLKLHIGAR